MAGYRTIHKLLKEAGHPAGLKMVQREMSSLLQARSSSSLGSEAASQASTSAGTESVDEIPETTALKRKYVESSVYLRELKEDREAMAKLWPEVWAQRGGGGEAPALTLEHTQCLYCVSNRYLLLRNIFEASMGRQGLPERGNTLPLYMRPRTGNFNERFAALRRFLQAGVQA